MGTEKDTERLHHCREFCWTGWTKGRSTNTAASWQVGPLLHRRGTHASWILLPCHLRSWTAWLCFKNKTRKNLPCDCNNPKPVNSWAAGLQEALPCLCTRGPSRRTCGRRQWRCLHPLPRPLAHFNLDASPVQVSLPGYRHLQARTLMDL